MKSVTCMLLLIDLNLILPMFRSCLSVKVYIHISPVFSSMLWSLRHSEAMHSFASVKDDSLSGLNFTRTYRCLALQMEYPEHGSRSGPKVIFSILAAHHFYPRVCLCIVLACDIFMALWIFLF